MTLKEQLTAREMRQSMFESSRLAAELRCCSVIDQADVVFSESGEMLQSESQKTLISKYFPQLWKANGARVLAARSASMPTSSVKKRRIAVLFSGGPAAGGHNVVLGMMHALREHTLYGVTAGPKGLMAGDLFEITDEAIASVRNLGGFDFLGSDRTKIKTDAQFEAVVDTVRHFHLDGLVVIGGDDSNTNAAFLAERLHSEGCAVIGVPKTIDGDLQVDDVLPISFGFDTATKIYAELVGNILQDTPSSRKYWHFVKVMGRSASHVALEVALQTKPTLAFISEEVKAKEWTLADVVSQIGQAVIDRSRQGMDYGVILIPEGLIEFIPEFTLLISELNELLADMNGQSHSSKLAHVQSLLSEQMITLFNQLPSSVQTQLLLDRDSHGNVKVSQIDTDALLVAMTETYINDHAQDVPFLANRHFFGYEGRCGAPSLFDAEYTYNLGITAGKLLLTGKTGYMVSISDVDSGGCPLALPLTGLIRIERREGVDVPVIQKALVELDSPAFLYFQSRRDIWCTSDKFCSPGPRQYNGETAMQLPMTVALNQGMTSLDFRFS